MKKFKNGELKKLVACLVDQPTGLVAIPKASRQHVHQAARRMRIRIETGEFDGIMFAWRKTTNEKMEKML